MYLYSKPAPTFHSCDRKIFHAAEYHVTRRYRHSVLILMLGGVLRFREDGVDVELRAGEYYVQRDGLQQEGVRLGECPDYYYLEFDGTYGEDAASSVPLRGRYPAEIVLPLMEECVSAFYGARPGRFYLSSILCRVLDALSLGQNDESQSARLAKRLKAYLEVNYPSAVTLGSLSAKFGYSENHLNRVFRAAYGVTPHRFLAGVRIAKAHWLLTSTDVPVHLVAEMVGYADPSAFYRSFVKTYGASPRAIRAGVGKRDG